MDKELTGIFNRKMDCAGRIKIPKNWLEISTFAIYSGEEQDTVMISSKEEFERRAKNLNVDIFCNDILVSFFSNVYTVDVDSKGRISIPAKFCNMAELLKDVVLVGKGNYALIIAKERYKE